MTAIDEARLVTARIVSFCNPNKVILFGSTAKGTGNPDSDIDLLVIKETSKRRPFRVKEIFESLRGMNRNYPLDAIVYTPAELETRLQMGDYFITEAISKGKVMYAI